MKLMRSMLLLVTGGAFAEDKVYRWRLAET
jgi:hypothetical protein